MTETRFTFAELDAIAARCKAEEYQLMIYTSGEDSIHVSLEKGSTYGKMHMKFTADATTVSEAFSKALANFPANPVGAVWDTKRVTQQEEKVEDGEFSEVPPPAPAADDEIPF